MNVAELNQKIETAEKTAEMAEAILAAYMLLKDQNRENSVIYACNKNKFIDLIRTRKAIIKNVDFSKENFCFTDFSNLSFLDCYFEFTSFEGCNMDAIKFRRCDISNSHFHGAFMECAAFIGCKCIATDFSNAHLLAAYICDSDWTEANVGGSNLLEIEAHNWTIDGMILNETTAILKGEFYDVDWSKTNVSNLNISIEQVRYFLQSANGGKYLRVYDNYQLSSIQQREDAILESLLSECQSDMMREKTNLGPDLIFFSYAFEQKNIVKSFYETWKEQKNLWMDLKLTKEEKLKEQLENVLVNCNMAVVFLSKEYLIKAWTRYEFIRLLQEQRERGIPIIIVVLSEVDFKSEILQIVEQEKITISNLDDLPQILINWEDEQ